MEQHVDDDLECDEDDDDLLGSSTAPLIAHLGVCVCVGGGGMTVRQGRKIMMTITFSAAALPRSLRT